MAERPTTPHIARIVPTRRNLETIVSLTNADLQTSGLSPEEAAQLADPQNNQHLETQRRKLLLHPARYLGAFASSRFGNELKGFIKYNEWRAADELPYAEAAEARLLKDMIAAEKHHLAGRPIGIFALCVASSLSQDAQPRFASALLHSVLEKFSDKEFRIGAPAEDPLVPLLRSYRFEPTGRRGGPISGISQELYIRPPIRSV